MLPAPLVVLLLALAAAGGLGALGLLAHAPNGTDEALYIELARHLVRSGRFEVLGVPFPPLTYAPAYVALIAPVYRLTASAHDAYVAIRELNAVVFASAAFPAFFIATRVVSRRTAVIVAAAAIALPAGVYATKVMTETLALAVVLWCVVGALRVVERPSLQRQGILLAGFALATAARFELLVLGPALVMSCILGGGLRVRKQLRALAPLATGTTVLTLAMLWLLHSTSSAVGETGTHGFDAGGFSVVRFFRTLVGSFGAVDLYSGVLPFGCLLLAALAVRRQAQWVTPALRILVLITVTGGAALLLVSSAYLASVPAAFRPPIPQDRYTFYLAPLLLAVFAAVLEAGDVRLRGARGVAAVAGAAPLLAAAVYAHHDPHGVFAWRIGSSVGHSGLAFLPWLVLGAFHPLVPIAGLAVYCGWCAYLLASGGTRRVHACVKPVLGLSSVSLVFVALFFVSGATGSPSPGWLDSHTSGHVIAVWGANPSNARADELVEMVAANDRLAAAYFTREPTSQALQAVERRVRERNDGTLLDRGRPIAADFVLTDAETTVVGTLVAKRDGLRIYKVESPVRLALPGD